jgi:pimeloyl-ACP methyl ester carboxylesterase
MWSEFTKRMSVPATAITFPGFDGRAVSTDHPDLGVFAETVLAEVPGPMVVAGCSMGGYVAMELMRRAPERLDGVILMDTKPESDAEAARQRRREIADGVERDGLATWSDVLTSPLLGGTSRSERVELVDMVRGRVLSANADGVAWAQRAMAERGDSRGTLANWQKPALVIVGEEDELSPVATAREMAELLPQGQLVVIPRAGHLAAWEQPEVVAEQVARWWATSFPPGE